MAKRKVEKVAKRKKVVKRKHAQKIAVKEKFLNAMKRLKSMKKGKQSATVLTASNEFIRDVSGFMSKIRKRGQLVNSKHRKVLSKHAKNLRKLIHAKTPVESKRLILSQRGGILPALIPIICALIGAGGGIAGAATSAAIIKN
jgi:hypothetical protein